MNTIDAKKINDEVEKFVKDRDWDQFHSMKNLAMALSVESSELLEIFQWMREDESNQAVKDSFLKEKIEDEIADIFVYLLRLANKSNIDIEATVLKKIKKNAEKYPIEKSKGNSKKYTEL